jgi:hypothetical protein
MEEYGGHGCIDPHRLDFGTSSKQVVSFTHWPLSPRAKSTPYPLYRRLGGPKNRSGRRGEHSGPYLNSNSDPSTIQPVASRYAD